MGVKRIKSRFKPCREYLQDCLSFAEQIEGIEGQGTAAVVLRNIKIRIEEACRIVNECMKMAVGPQITVYYSPNNWAALKEISGTTYFEQLRMEFGEEGAVQQMLKGGKFLSTDDVAWLVMSYAIRKKGADPDDMVLYEHSDNFGWRRIHFDEEGELRDELVSEKGSIRIKLLF